MHHIIRVFGHDHFRPVMPDAQLIPDRPNDFAERVMYLVV